MLVDVCNRLILTELWVVKYQMEHVATILWFVDLAFTAEAGFS